MYEFYKHKDEFTEGYLGEPEKFNGIIFLLKEPNNLDGAKEFWLKKVLNNSTEYHRNLEENGKDKKDITRSKRTFTAFKNRFMEMLEFIGLNKEDLQNSVFCNIHPVCGANTETKTVEKAIKETSEEMLYFLSTLKSDITIFTCKNIYRHLLESDKIPYKTQKTGLSYKNQELGCFKCEINNTRVTVYEIYHPSRSGKILNKNNADIP